MLLVLLALIGTPLAAEGTSTAAASDAHSALLQGELDPMAAKLRSRVGDDAGLGAIVVKFDLGRTGAVFLDGKSTPNTVSLEGKKADVTITLSKVQMESWLDGKLSLAAQADSGRLKVEGDMGVAHELDKLFK